MMAVIHRAAMGRARFIIYPYFIIFFNRAAMGRARFIIYPCFIIFLTEPPWAEYTFSFGFKVGFEGKNKYAKKVLRRHGMH